MKKETEGHTLRVMLVDDHMVVRAGLAYAIGNEPGMEVVAQAGDGLAAVELYRIHKPDIVLLDLRMPNRNGIETIAELRKESRSVRVLVLSSYAGGNEIAAALTAGAGGFLGKEAPFDVLMDAIRRVAAGEQVVHNEEARRLASRLSSQLSPREIEVLKLVGSGLRNKEVGDSLKLMESTVKVHLANIFTKLGVSDRTQAVLAGIRRGIIHLE